MIYYIVFDNEKDRHELEKSTCKCLPGCRFISSGDMLLVHNRIDDADDVVEEEIVSEAIKMIANFNNKN